ncbi:Transcriptional activator ARO80 [Ceratocystis lukuohia]|uniref:Transcriptional activator ARO80 n=1 Tax=Ceratocystis lukuohia TaxID=2019550 RepID=A0ABR4MN48_9PEZI
MYDTSTDGLSSTEAANNGSPSKPAAVRPPNTSTTPHSTTPSITEKRPKSSTPSDPQSQTAQANLQHKRVYQACIPCRRRKVRCDLGSVDNPHDPPCVRCRRESKDCFFSATRRKRKTDNLDGELESDEYIIRNGRKRLHAGEAPHTPIDRSIYSEAPLTPGGSIGRREPLRRPGDTSATTRDFSSGEDSNAQLANLEAQEVMRDRVYGPHDALDLLYKAATDRFVQQCSPVALKPEHSSSSSFFASAATRSVPVPAPISGPPPAPNLTPTPALMSTYKPSPWIHPRSNMSLSSFSPIVSSRQDLSRASSTSMATPTLPQVNPSSTATLSANTSAPPRSHSRRQSRAERSESRASKPTIDSSAKVGLDMAPGLGISTGIGLAPNITTQDGMERALKAWGRFRFVRAGWFTAQEAIAYIDYYYTYLSPLTPISPPTFRNPASHETLLSEEPILTVTLLTITSRYMKLSGPGGHCRSNAIHEQLWTYLRGMVERCLWGQEAFGGRLHPSGPTEDFQTSSTAPWRGMRKGSLRTLGTIESLMILTEWHPRALHFPPTEAIDELMLPNYEATFASEAEQRQEGSFGGKRIESWLEPAWRSDRMCWMLLSTAMGLAHELGVFDDIDELLRDGSMPRPEYEDEGYRQRAYRIKRLLLIYLTQLAGRLGWKNMVPEQLWKTDPAVGRKHRRDTMDGTTPASHSSISIAFNYIPDLELDDQIIHCWAGVSNAMHIGNERLFKSRQHTTEIIQSGQYIELLREFQPMLYSWWKEFDRFRLPPYIRHILTIEYEYVRIYINSLSLQAVVERCTNHAANATAGNHDAPTNTEGDNAIPQLSPQTQNYYGKLPLGQLGGFTQEDQTYIREVVDGCRNLLRIVVYGLLPKGYLKHAPVRTYFRIISGAMFLLKTFALGAPRSDVKISIGLMDQAVEALRNCVVDDVHLGVRFADLLETLTSRLRTRFIQAPVMPGTTSSTSATTGNQGSLTPNGGDSVMAMDGVTHGVSIESEWVSSHAARLQEGLREATSPSVAIAATPFDLNNFHFAATNSLLNTDNTSTPLVDPSTSHLADGPSRSASTNTTNHNAATIATAGAVPSSAASAAGSTTTSNALNAGSLGFEDWTGGEMWYLPPGPAFLQNVDSNNVQMTSEGVNVGGTDLLDYLAMDSFPPIDTNGGSGGGDGGSGGGPAFS